MNWMLLQNSLLVGGLTAVLATVLGGMAALWLAGLPRGWQALLLALSLAGLALPPFLVTNSWLHFLGHNGVWRGWLAFNLFSLGGTVWILTLLLWPLTLLFVWSAWQRLEPAQLEADPVVRGAALLRALLLPLARPALLQAAVLTFVLALSNFSVPAILQVKVFPAEMWVRFSTTFDTWGALQLSWPLVLAPLALLWWLSRRQVPWPHWHAPVTPRLFRRQLGEVWHTVAGLASCSLLLLSVALPVLQLAGTRRTWTELPGALAAGGSALWHSFWFAAITATLVLGVGMLGWAWLKPWHSAFRFRIGSAAGWALWFCFLLPGVLLGIGMIVVFNRPALEFIYQTASIVFLALLVRYLAIGWHTVGHACGATDRDLVDAALVEGANRWQIWRHVYWPQIAPQGAMAWYVVFLLCLWDVESMVLIVPPGGETLALRVFNLLHYGHNAQVNALCLLLLVVAVTPLLAWQAARLRRAAAVPALLGIAVFFMGCSRSLPPNAARVRSEVFDHVQVIATRGAGAGQVNKPRSVAVDSVDSLFVVDMTGRVQKFSSNGVFELHWQMPQTDRGRPKGMCRDAQGRVVVLEPHYARVNHFTPQGNLAFQWGDHGTNTGQLGFPRAIAVNRQGEIIVSEYSATERVQRFRLRDPGETTNTVEFVNAFGRMGNLPGEFNRPEGLCVDAQDRIYVADSCNHRIQVFSREGKFITAYGKAGSGPGELSYPYDICIDSEGRQYVCEFGNSRIQVFDASHQPLEIIGGPGAEPGRFSNPWGVALDSAENLYVADSQNHRVQKFIRRPGLQQTRAQQGRGERPREHLEVQREGRGERPREPAKVSWRSSSPGAPGTVLPYPHLLVECEDPAQEGCV